MRSKFNIVQVDEDRVFIEDLCEQYQCMSITNDAENVAQFINEQYPGKRLIYRDTMGVWDEIVVNGPGLFKTYLDYLPEGY